VFYARLSIPDPETGTKKVQRVRLPEAKTVPQAAAALEHLKVKRREKTLPPTKRTPTLKGFAKDYFALLDATPGRKRPKTILSEHNSMRRWCEFAGERRLAEITPAVIHRFQSRRLNDGLAARSVNLELIALRNVLNLAIDHGFLSALPKMKRLPERREAKSLITGEEIDHICDIALEHAAHGQAFVDYIRLMQYSGGRAGETLRLPKTAIDFERRQMLIGSDGLSKGRDWRHVDFNADLEAHLIDMQERLVPDSVYLFPSPRRGESDIPCGSLNMTLRKVRELAGLPKFTLHLLRHYFASHAVMNNIDYMTLAKWLGHKDGGVLIGKVYGHLADEHRQKQAAKLTF
jgi:integrase